MKLVYIAGPYRATYPYQVQRNIQAAVDVALDMCLSGFDLYPVVPHANTAHFDGVRDGQFFVDGTADLCRGCDAIVVLSGWQNSIGTRGEIDIMRDLGKPVFFLDEIGSDWSKISVAITTRELKERGERSGQED